MLVKRESVLSVNSLSLSDDVIIVWSIDVARDPEFLGLMTYSKSSNRKIELFKIQQHRES